MSTFEPLTTRTTRRRWSRSSNVVLGILLCLIVVSIVRISLGVSTSVHIPVPDADGGVLVVSDDPQRQLASNQSHDSTTPNSMTFTTSTTTTAKTSPQPILLPRQQQEQQQKLHEICFITSEFSDSPSHADIIPIINPTMRTNPPRHFLFTNMLSHQLLFAPSTSMSSTISSSLTNSQQNNSSTILNMTFSSSAAASATTSKVLHETGWQIIRMTNSDIPGGPYQRVITQSRWPKFLGYLHPTIIERNCSIIFYGDAYLLNPINESIWQQMATQILDHSSPSSTTTTRSTSSSCFGANRTKSKSSSSSSSSSFPSSSQSIGLMQQIQMGANRKPVKGPVVELKLNARMGKLSWEMANLTIQWLRNQSDYQRKGLTRVYKNALIGYNPNDCMYRLVSTEFWKIYSQEFGSWRDQPYWAYILSRHNVQPIPLIDPSTTAGRTDSWSAFLGPPGQLGHNGHIYVLSKKD